MAHDRRRRWRRARRSGSRNESLPGRAPIGPNSSPATRIWPGLIPRRQSSAKIQRAESALSVRPISTCFASLVTFAAARPASRAARSATVDGFAQPVESRRSQPTLDGDEQLADPRLRRVGPLRFRDQVDLATVETLRHDLRPESVRGEARDGCRRRSVERLLLGRRRDPPLDEPWPRLVDDVNLRAAIETEIELSGAGRSRAELPVDVGEVGSRDDGEIHACGAECFDRSAQGDGISGAVGNGGAVPVEDNGLEAPVHLWRKRNGNLERVHWALRCRCHRNRTHRRRRRRASHRRHRGHLVRRTTERN